MPLVGGQLTALCHWLITVLDISECCPKEWSAFYLNKSMLFTYLFCIDINIEFNQSTYNVNEDDGPAQPVLVLSNPSSTDITLQVRSNDITATGE